MNLYNFVGKWCPLQTLIQRRVADTIEYLTDLTDPPDIFNVKGTVGYDGNGRNSVFRSCNKGATMILGGCAITSIHNGDGKLEYEEKSLGPDRWFSVGICKCKPGYKSHDLL